MMKNSLILGATSEIAFEFIALLGPENHLHLAGKNPKQLGSLKALTKQKKIPSDFYQIDFSNADFDPKQHFSSIVSDIDTFICFVGDMGMPLQEDFENVAKVHQINFLNPVKSVLYFLSDLKQKSDARIVFVSSVAGERGRKKNYVYGSAKGALTIFASGLRASLSSDAVTVTTILLGMVDTNMTSGITSPLISKKGKVAKSILEAIQNQREVVYIPFFWRWIMFVIKLIPERFFKRLSF